MPRPEIAAIRFRPPVVIARLGDSDSPLEAFSWAEDTRLFGSAQTLIEPRISLEVLPDGSVEPYLPGPIRFRDGRTIRPVCPFLELEAQVRGDDEFQPLTATLIEAAGFDLSQLNFNVVAANRKAVRRTNEETCGFEARLFVYGNDHARHDLLAWTRAAGNQPLVSQDRPIWLGAFQAIRPVRRKAKYEVGLDTVRVRFTPGRGAVYGPPSAVEGQSSTSRGRYEIVPEENRILNPQAAWCSYNSDTAVWPSPVPAGTYDGESDLDRDNAGWGVVDDTCDAIVTATLAGQSATARVLVGPPDFAPDRRPFYSIADDLADRDPESLAPASAPERREAVADLFRRIHETASIINLERTRNRQLEVNQSLSPSGGPIDNPPGFPAIDTQSMTVKDLVAGQDLMSIRFDALAAEDAGDTVDRAPLLPKSELARSRHGELAMPEVMLEFVRRYPERFRAILRPPFRRLSDPDAPSAPPDPLALRDPRAVRSYTFDARMPPYMRDSDYAPLSLTRHQWELLFERQPDGAWAVRKELLSEPEKQ